MTVYEDHSITGILQCLSPSNLLKGVYNYCALSCLVENTNKISKLNKILQFIEMLSKIKNVQIQLEFTLD